MNLGKIKSLFIVEDEIENQKEASTDAPVENQTTPPDKEVSISEGDVNKMVGMLSKAMSEANIDGFDYLEFKDAVIAFKNTLTDPYSISCIDLNRMTFWGCRFFDNEQDARKSFG